MPNRRLEPRQREFTRPELRPATLAVYFVTGGALE